MNKLTNIFSTEKYCAKHAGAVQNTCVNSNGIQNTDLKKLASNKILVLLIAIAAILLVIAATTTAFAKYATAETPGNINLTIKPAYTQMSAEASGEGTVAPTENFYAKIGEAITIDSLNDSSITVKTTEGNDHKITQTPNSSKCCLEKWVLVDDNGNETTIESGVTKVTENSKKIKGYFKVYECLTLTNTSTTNDTVQITIQRTSDNWDYIPNAQYSFDGKTWYSYTISLDISQEEKQVITLEAGKSVQFKGNNPCHSAFSETKYGWSNYVRRTFFTMTGTTNPCIEASGHLIALINDGDVASEQEIIRQYCFKELFKDCKLLKSAKNLRLNSSSNGYATNLCGYYFLGMFENCTALVDSPALPVPVESKASRGVGLKDGCYKNMFKGCTSLKAVPELKASTREEMAESCYESMFEGCTSLEKAQDVLPATDLTDKIKTYNSMFAGCKALTKTPQIKAQTLSSDCCASMFYGCESLSEASDLPATTLAPRCYQKMFFACKNLEQGPDLMSTTTSENCYEEMFNGCSNLKKLKVGFTSWKSGSFTSKWLQDTSETGEIVCPEELLKSYEPSPSTIPATWIKNPCILSFDGNAPEGKTVTGVPESTKASKGIIIPISTSVPSIVEACDPPIVFMYWTDGSGKRYNPGDTIEMRADITLTANWVEKTPLNLEKVVNPAGKATINVSSATKPSVADKISVNSDGELVVEHTGGDITYSLSGVTENWVLQNWCIVLKDGTEMPVGNETGCINMLTLECAKVKANFAEYKGLKFKNESGTISNVTLSMSGTSPVTPSLKYCVDGVVWKDYSSEGFNIKANGGYVLLKSNGWSSASSTATFSMSSTKIKASGKVISLLDNGLCSDDTTLQPHCFESMFKSCGALFYAPELPSTSLADYCYSSMFYECTSLKKAPELPAEELKSNCYASMFRGCSSLIEAPVLKATDIDVTSCYDCMFFDCSSLSFIKVYFSTWSTKGGTDSWVGGTCPEKENCNFWCPKALDTSKTGTSLVPKNWTIHKF